VDSGQIGLNVSIGTMKGNKPFCDGTHKACGFMHTVEIKQA
jgi:CDGSH-type Zn-finger protein